MYYSVLLQKSKRYSDCGQNLDLLCTKDWSIKVCKSLEFFKFQPPSSILVGIQNIVSHETIIGHPFSGGYILNLTTDVSLVLFSFSLIQNFK